MLFQCVGAIENTTESRNIETMDGLAMRYPKLGIILMLGIAGMFLVGQICPNVLKSTYINV